MYTHSASYTRPYSKKDSDIADPDAATGERGGEIADPAGASSMMGGLGLNQYRRHCASMSAAPIRGSQYASMASRPLPARSSSWAPESPRKKSLQPQIMGASGMQGTAYGIDTGAVTKTPSRSRGGGSFEGLFARFRFGRGLFAKKAAKHAKRELISWVILTCLIVVGYKFFSDGSFSAILTLASAFQCFSLTLLNMKVVHQRSVAGISQRSLLLIIVCLLARLASTLFYNGYLPVDRSGDWVYQVADLLTVCLVLSLMGYARLYCTTSIQQQSEKDTCNILFPLIGAFILACLIHPNLNQNLLADVAWTFALYVETFTMIPQLFMMGKLGGEVEALTSHFVASMAASKIFACLFWSFSFGELAPRNGGKNFAGWAVMSSYVLQTLLFADFFYYYVRSMKVGSSMIIDF